MLLHLRYGSSTLILAARRWPALPASCAAVAAVLGAGGFGPTLPSWWEALGGTPLVGLIGLVLAAGAGLLAFHLARVAGGGQRATARGWRAALAAALVPTATIPGIGAAALMVPIAAAAALLPDSRAERGGALAALASGALGVLAARMNSPALGCIACAMMLAVAWVLILRTAIPAANDNPWLERPRDNWLLPEARPCATHFAGTREPGNGEDSDVQQQ